MKEPVDVSDLKRSTLERMLKVAMSKLDDEERKKVEAEEGDKEQNDLVDLHAEKGDSKAPKVTKDDIPADIRKVVEDSGDDEESEGEEGDIEDKKPKFGKPKNPAKKKKNSFPFQKKA